GGAALTRVDDTNVTLTLGGTPASALLAATSLTLGWTGQLSIARGGHGQATAAAGFDALSPLTTAGDLLTFTTTNARLAMGTANQLLVVNTAGTAPVYKNLTTNAVAGLGWSFNASNITLVVDPAIGEFVNLANVRGDLHYTDATPVWNRLPIGTSGKFLRSDGTDPSWQPIVTSDISDFDVDLSEIATLANVQGDLLYTDASAIWNRLPIGSANTVLHSNGTTLSWAALVEADLPNLTSAQWAAHTTDETGTGKLTFATSPAFLTGISVTSAAAIVNTTDTYLVQAAVSATSDGSTGGVLKVFGITGTLTQNVAPGVISHKGFINDISHVISAGTALPNFSTVVHRMTSTASGVALVSGLTLSFVDEQFFSVAAGGTFGGTISHTGFWSAPTVNAGVTLPARYGVRISEVSGAGSISGNNIGVDIETLA